MLRIAHRANTAIEREFAEKNVGIENFAEETSLTAGEAQRHGQIERGAFLTDVRGGEIHGDGMAGWKIEAGIAQRGAYAFAAFFYGDIGKADDIEKALAHRDYVHFDFDEVGVNAEHGCAKRLEEHPKRPFAG